MSLTMETKTCIPVDRMRAYLEGWASSDDAVSIESHLSECQECEQTLLELEADSDTLIESLRNRPPIDPRANQPTAPDAPAWSVGAYEIIRAIGRGGMGVVYLARHRELGREVALKILPPLPGDQDQHTARFLREIRTSGSLDHPAIARATDAGNVDGVQFMAMEYVQGSDLSAIAKRVGRLKIADVCQIARGVAQGLEYAHSRGVIHRDIKPSNVMLDESGAVKILDFGLARLSHWDDPLAELTTVGQLMGTLDYMAPEQAENPGGVDFRADLYSLGAMMFRLLCGRSPLVASPHLSPLSKLQLLTRHDLPRLSTLRPDVPEELAELVDRMLAKSLDDRPASAARVEEAVGPWCEGSDLAALVEQAATAEADPADSIPAALSRPFTSSVAAGREPRDSRGGGGDGRRRWGWIAGALLPLSLIAAVVITLQTERGLLVIESEIDDVQVELRRDGEKVKDLQIETGANTTRVWGGKYEVRLAEGSDRVTIDQDHFEIRRGETVVARIRQTRGSAEASVQAESSGAVERVADASPASSTEVIDQPTYQGKPIDHWLSVVKHERDTGLVHEALTAVKELVSPDTEERVRQGMLETIDRHQLPRAFDILAMTDPQDEYVQLMLQQLQQGDAKRRRVVLEYGLFPASILGWDLTPLLDWIDANLLDQKSDESMRHLAALLYVELINGRSDRRHHGYTDAYRRVGTLADELKQRLLITLRESRMLDSRILAGEFSVGRVARGTHAPELRQLAIDRSLEILKSTDVAEPEFVEAILVLRAHLTDSSDPREHAWLHTRFVEDEACLLALQRGLQLLLERPEGLYLITQISDNSHVAKFAWPHLSAMPRSLNPLSGSRSEIKAKFDKPGNHVSPVLEILNLLIALAEGTQFTATTEFGEPFKQLVERTEQGYVEVFAFKGEIRRKDRQRLIVFHWPSLQTTYEPFLAAEQDSSPTLQQWMDFFINIHARYSDRRTPELDPRFLNYAQTIIQRYDTNGDGRLEAAEWESMLMDPSDADVNRDGFITVEEYARCLESQGATRD